MIKFRGLSWLSVAATLGLAGAVFIASPAMADDHAENHHVQESHVYGLASLFIVLEGEELLIELESPTINLLGFEHAVHSEERHQQVKKTHQRLAVANELFDFRGGKCQRVTADIDMAHDEHNEAHKEPEAEHSGVEAKYLSGCQQPEALAAIDVTLFKPFPAVQELDAQWVVRSHQDGKTLSPERSRIELQ